VTALDPRTVVPVRLSDLAQLPASPARNRLYAIAASRAREAAARREERRQAALAAEAARRAELEAWAAAVRVRAEEHRLNAAAHATYSRMAARKVTP